MIWQHETRIGTYTVQMVPADFEISNRLLNSMKIYEVTDYLAIINFIIL